jgi:hypothetical protein
VVIDDRVMLDDEDIHINVVFQQSLNKERNDLFRKRRNLLVVDRISFVLLIHV